MKRLLIYFYKLMDKIFNIFGYELRNMNELKSQYISYQTLIRNFENLVSAFEVQFNKDNIILPNDNRPKLLARLLGTPPSEAYFIIQELHKSINLEGDICEFGVAQGETSVLIANEIKSYNNKILHLFDSFEGLPKPTEKDKLKDDIFSLGSIESYSGTMSSPITMVQKRLNAISFPTKRYFIHKGFIEDLINKGEYLPQKVCFAYLDFDFYEPTKLVLNYLNEVTSNKATIIVDDYDFFSTGVKIAVDEFIKEKRIEGFKYKSFIPNKIFGHFIILTKIVE